MAKEHKLSIGHDLQNKIVLVTGATGFVGGALCTRLSTLGITTKALARRAGRDAQLRDLPHIEVVMGDITDVVRMHEVMAGVDIVFHVAAALSGDLAYQRHVNVEGTWNVIEAAKHQGVERVIHVSSIAVFGYYHPDGVIEEDSFPTPSEEAYSLSKAEAETVVVEESNGLSYVIVRPGGIYGAHSGLWTKTMFQLASRRPIIFPGDGRGSAPLIYISDLIDLMLIASIHPNADGQAFNACYDPSYTWRELLTDYAKLQGRDAHWIGIPMILVRPLVRFLSWFAPRYSQLKIAPHAINFVTQPIKIQAQKAHDLLGWQPATSLEDGTRLCAPYLHEKGLLK